ncbi:hypothetical protein ACHAQA_001726 [Verticillium albo-atrum]
MEETLEQIQARHRKEQRDLVARTTSKKKNATKKTRKGVNDECAELERLLKERQAEELAAAAGGGPADVEAEDEEEEDQNDEGPAQDDVDKLAGQLNGAAITGEETAQQQQGEAQGKKRNRQKERLARRAAELEEEAVRAEEEAKNMTDHRGLEKKYMAGVFKANALVEKDIQPDGHCLFSAVADQLKQRGIALGEDGDGEKKGEPYRIVRRAAADWMAARPDDYAPFLEEPLDGYLAKIRDTAEWGGQLELAALAARYGVEIKVVQDGRTETIETPGGGEGKAAEVIWLAYYRHGYGLGEHYNSLRKTA